MTLTGEPTVAGSVRLMRPIARGGMGEVWLGHHGELHRDVAVKFLRAGLSGSLNERSSFALEVGALAALDHPSILKILDYGRLDAPLSLVADDPLPDGTPYLVTEYASGGDLGAWLRRPREWHAIRAVLERLLDALAAAHAAGVLHLDLKPTNLLWCGPGDLRPGLKLADFGVARRSDHFGKTIGGTPGYMAPEQWLGAVTRLGPWTDLFGLGAVAWAFVSGRSPHGRSEPPRMQRSLSEADWGTPRVPVPAGLLGWLLTMLAPDPRQRFQRAADARWALQSLPEPDDAGFLPTPTTRRGALVPPTVAPRASEPTQVDSGATWTLIPTEGASTAPAAPVARPIDAPPGNLGTRPLDTPPPPPARWREPGSLTDPFEAAATTARLFAVRRPPLVGRTREQDALWSALLDVVREQRPRAVVLRGPAGVGRTRLADWIAEAAHASGAGEIFRASFTDQPSGSDALRAMVLRPLGAEGLPPNEAQALVTAALSPDDPRAPTLARQLVADPELSATSPPGAQVRTGAALALISQLAGARAAVVVLDDVHWSSEAIALCEQAMWSDQPLLAVLTATNESLGDLPGMADDLAKLLAHPAASALPIEPLRRHHWATLVSALCPVPEAVGALVAERSAGNPKVASWLIARWRDLARSGIGSEQAVRQMSATLDPGALATERLDRALAGHPDDARRGVELAATLGLDVRPDEWSAACAAAGVRVPPDLVESLVRLGLARPSATDPHGTWAFAHRQLQEAALASARDAGRDAENHRCSAEALRALGTVDGPRLGRLLLSGRDPSGLELLIRAGPDLVSRGSSGEALVTVALAMDHLEGAGAPPDDPRRGSLRATELIARHRIEGNSPAVVERMDALESDARAFGWSRPLGKTLLRRAYRAGELGHLEAGLRAADEILTLRELRATGDTLLGGAENVRGLLLHRANRHAEAAEALERAAAWWANDLDPGNRIAPLENLAQVYNQMGRSDEARALLERAAGLADQFGLTHLLPGLHNTLGELQRAAGDLRGAEASYTAALVATRSPHDLNAIYPLLNLAILQLASGRVAAAQASLQRALAATLIRRVTFLQIYARILIIRCEAEYTNLDAVAEHVAAVMALCSERCPHDADLGRAMDEAEALLSGVASAALLAQLQRIGERVKP